MQMSQHAQTDRHGQFDGIEVLLSVGDESEVDWLAKCREDENSIEMGKIIIMSTLQSCNDTDRLRPS
jgi:hypothetical protein